MKVSQKEVDKQRDSKNKDLLDLVCGRCGIVCIKVKNHKHPLDFEKFDQYKRQCKGLEEEVENLEKKLRQKCRELDEINIKYYSLLKIIKEAQELKNCRNSIKSAGLGGFQE